MISSEIFHKDETFFIVLKLLENSLEIATMELVCVEAGGRSPGWSPEINFIVNIFMEKF